MDLTRINRVGRLEKFLAMKKLMDLNMYENYQITNLKKVQTKYGVRIKVDVNDSFTVLLLARMTSFASRL